MFTVRKLNEQCIFFVFSAKKDFGDCICTVFLAHGTNTDLSTQTTTTVGKTPTTAPKNLVARFVTSWTIAQLTTSFATQIMGAPPRAFVTARHTGLPTLVLALGVDATVLARQGTWRTGHWTRFFAKMRTYQHTITLGSAPFVYTAHSALATLSRALMITFQSRLTEDWTIYLSGRASNSDFMTTWPIRSLFELLAFFGTRFTTTTLTAMRTRG